MWDEAAKRYLAAFAAKDEKGLQEMYSSEVEFIDPEAHFVGKADLMEDHRGVWEEFDTISIQIKNTCYRDKLVCVESSIFTEKKGDIETETPIVSLILFDSWGKIKQVRTYIQ
jgi:hypothetical protein